MRSGLFSLGYCRGRTGLKSLFNSKGLATAQNNYLKQLHNQVGKWGAKDMKVYGGVPSHVED